MKQIPLTGEGCVDSSADKVNNDMARFRSVSESVNTESRAVDSKWMWSQTCLSLQKIKCHFTSNIIIMLSK